MFFKFNVNMYHIYQMCKINHKCYLYLNMNHKYNFGEVWIWVVKRKILWLVTSLSSKPLSNLPNEERNIRYQGGHLPFHNGGYSQIDKTQLVSQPIERMKTINFLLIQVMAHLLGLPNPLPMWISHCLKRLAQNALNSLRISVNWVNWV